MAAMSPWRMQKFVRRRMHRKTARQRILFAVGLARLVEDRMEPKDLELLQAVETYVDGGGASARGLSLLRVIAVARREAEHRRRAAEAAAYCGGLTPDGESSSCLLRLRVAEIVEDVTNSTLRHGTRHVISILCGLHVRPLSVPEAKVFATLDDVYPLDPARQRWHREKATWPPAFDRAREMAAVIYANRSFEDMPVLADALEDAGCDLPDVLDHCRRHGAHCRGCWLLNGLVDGGLKRRLLKAAGTPAEEGR